jgi:malonate transporter and related proteins
MLEQIALVLPLFGLILLGFLAASFGTRLSTMGDSLADFIYFFATPALLFKLIVMAKLPPILPWGYLLAYYSAVLGGWMGVSLLARGVFSLSKGDSVIAGLCCAQANTVMVGIPLILQTYGDEAGLPIAVLIAFNLPITMTIATLALEGVRAATLSQGLKNLSLTMVTHPILLAIFFALLFRYAALTLPAPVFAFVEMLAICAIPCALISLGFALKRYGLRGDIKPVLVITVFKLLLIPTVVFLLGTYVFTLSRLWLGAAVLFAAMPAGINAYLFARRYGQGEALASSSIAITTFLSLFTSIFWLYILRQ